MGRTNTNTIFSETYKKLTHGRIYEFLLILLGIPVHIITFLMYKVGNGKNLYDETYQKVKQDILSKELHLAWRQQFLEQEKKKAAFFQETLSDREIEKIVDALVEDKIKKEVEKEVASTRVRKIPVPSILYESTRYLQSFYLFQLFQVFLCMHCYLLNSNPFIQFIFERVIQTVFVIFGVATLVFTILYISPLDPARNLLGIEATPAQIENFNRLYGLDQPYFVQLWNSLTGLFTFDLGTSYAGKEDIMASIANKFPVTLEIAIFSLLMAIAIAIPVGIISAVRTNSFLDYTFMIIALIGLSIPSFWQGLIFILTFSLELKWFPATYNPGNWLSLVLPIVVLGTSLTASIARMTRSSMLEVINEDYIITAKAKGLNERKVISKHAIRNAMIPIITVIGLLFGGMLGGASVTEKVFNISGIGSYIVDKQFIPDIPAILGGVVYIAITISIVNLIIDILYAFFDPRIRSKMKKS